MAEGIGFTGMPTYRAYGVNPPTTAFPEATTTSELVTSSSAPRWYAADYHHPLPATGAYVDVPGYATLSGLRRGPESCEGRSRGSGRSFNRSLSGRRSPRCSEEPPLKLLATSLKRFEINWSP